MRTQKGHLFKRAGTWHVRFKVGGKPTTRTTGKSSRREAEKVRAELMRPFAAADEVEIMQNLASRIESKKGELAKIEEERNPPPTIGQVWSVFLDSPSRPDSGEATLKQYASEWHRFAGWIGRTRPDVNHLHDVTRQHAEAYAADLNAAKVSASTFNQHRNLLRMVWRVLEDAARLSGNPWDKITPRQLTALATRKRALTPAQFDALLAATETDVDLHDLFTLLAWTGQRLVDGVTLRWGTVDFSRGIITLAPQKTARRTGKQVHIPLFPAVRALLDRRQAGSILDPSAFVFPAIVEEYERDGGATLSKRIGAAFTLAGMETTEERADRARGVTVYGAHSLRHHFVTAAASAGMPSAMIKSITGHATDAMQEHYVQIGADLAREIAARMTAKALPVVGGCPAMEPIAPALKGKLEALRAIANRIGPDTWPGCKAELFGVLDAINK